MSFKPLVDLSPSGLAIANTHLDMCLRFLNRDGGRTLVLTGEASPHFIILIVFMEIHPLTFHALDKSTDRYTSMMPPFGIYRCRHEYRYRPLFSIFLTTIQCIYRDVLLKKHATTLQSLASGIPDYRSPGRPPHKPINHHDFMRHEV